MPKFMLPKGPLYYTKLTTLKKTALFLHGGFPYTNDDHAFGDVDDVDDKNNNHGTRRKTSQ